MAIKSYGLAAETEGYVIDQTLSDLLNVSEPTHKERYQQSMEETLHPNGMNQTIDINKLDSNQLFKYHIPNYIIQ